MLLITACTSPGFEPRPANPPPPPEAGVRARDMAPGPVFIPLSEKKPPARKKGQGAPAEEAEPDARSDPEEEEAEGSD